MGFSGNSPYNPYGIPKGQKIFTDNGMPGFVNNRFSGVMNKARETGQSPRSQAKVSGTGPAPDPGKGSAYSPQAKQQQPQGPAFGTESGPGILEQWFNMRAGGTDPAFEYASERGMEALGNRYSAAGNFNSGAARRGESDLMANLVAQRMGQLDYLAGGASAEHMGRLGAMFGAGTNIAGGEAGLSSAYDLGAAGNMAAANQAQQQMALNKAGVDSQANQALFNNALSIGALATGFGGGRRPGSY